MVLEVEPAMASMTTVATVATVTTARVVTSMRSRSAVRDPAGERDASSSDSECTDRSTSSSVGDKRARPTPSQPHRKPHRKPRKSTHAVRKEEKQQLMLEMEQLQAQMNNLKRRALASRDPTAQTCVNAAVLRSALQERLEQFVDAQVLFSAIGMTQVVSPIALPIRLGCDRRERLATLEALKAKRLTMSRAFLTRRCGALDPRKPHSEDQRFETQCGDYCAVRFGCMQFVGAPSVRHVFDILCYYYSNIEISISETLGSITIREDDDIAERGVSQHRLVTANSAKLLIESNSVLFTDFVNDASGGCGLIAAEFVDHDELYPYRPDQRVRKDISTILQITSHTQRVVSDTGDARDELVVVLTRWSYSRLHRPAFPVPQAVTHELREGMAKWCEAMHRTLRESLYPQM